MPLNGAVGGRAGADKFEDFLHLYDVALKPGHFGDRGHLALAIRLTLQLNDQLDGIGDLAADRGNGHRQARHADHLFETGKSVARRIGVDRRHRAFVTRVHGLQHVEGFFAAALAEDDAVRTHTQRVLHQLALTNLTLAFDTRRTRLHTANVRL